MLIRPTGLRSAFTFSRVDIISMRWLQRCFSGGEKEGLPQMALVTAHWTTVVGMDLINELVNHLANDAIDRAVCGMTGAVTKAIMTSLGSNPKSENPVAGS